MCENFSIIRIVGRNITTTAIEKSLNEDLPGLKQSKRGLVSLMNLQEKDEKLFKKGLYVMSPVCV